MKKNLLLMALAAMLSVVTYAQKPFEGAKVADLNATFAQNEVLVGEAPASAKAQRNVPKNARAKKAASDFEIITEQPQGELKKYSRSGNYLYASGSSLYIGTQSGFAYVVFGDDNAVYFKDPVSYLQFGSWVKGTLSEDGTKITVPLKQNLFYNEDYDACIATGVNQPYSTPNPSITEITYTVTETTITLDTYKNYSNGTFGGVWTDDGTRQGYGDYGTVYTLFEEPEVVTPPSNLETKEMPFTASKNGSTDYSSTVNVGWEGDDVYVQGIVPEIGQAWVKGTKDDSNSVVFQIQYMGSDDDRPYYLSGYSSGNVNTFTMTYDPDEDTFTASGSMMIIASATAMSTSYFYNGAIIGTPPTPIDVPEGLETEALVLRGQYYQSSQWNDIEEGVTVNVGFDGDDVYFQGILTDVPEGWVKGTITTNDDGTKKVVIPTGQYVGKDTTYGSGTYFVASDQQGNLQDAELSYFEDGPYFVIENYVWSNGKKKQIYYNYYYRPQTTIGISGAENALNDAIDEAEELVADESNELGVDELNEAIQAALAALNAAVYPEDFEAALKALQEAIDAFKKANSAKPEEEVTVEDIVAQWVAKEQGYANQEEVFEFNIDENVTATAELTTGKTTPKYFNNGTSYRLYSGSKLTISGKNINKIEFLFGDATNTQEFSAESGTYSLDGTTGTWKGEADEVVFNRGGTSGHVRIAGINVYYKKETIVDNRVYLKGGEANDGKFYATYYNGEEPYAVNGEGVTAYTATVDDDKESLILEEIEDGLIPAGAAVILIAEAEDITLVPGKPYTRDFNNVLVGFDEETQIESGSYYGLAVKEGIAGYYKIALESVPANKAYLKAEDAAAAKQFIPFGKTTAVETIEAAEAQNNGVVYNLQGQRVSNAQKGIYIIGGKKVIKK